MARDVFISHAQEDKDSADAVCRSLEARGIGCWIAPRDIPPGMRWDDAIHDAISNCKVMVLIFTANANNSQWVKSEVSLAADFNSEIIPFRITDASPTRGMQLLLGTRQWLDALTPPLEAHIARLAEQIAARGIGAREPRSREKRLWRAGAFAEFWEPVVRPWLKGCAAGALGDNRPSVVVVPSRSVGHGIKGRWAQEGKGGIGIRFWTPGDLRRHLLGVYCPWLGLAGREVLHLLLSQAADACSGRSSGAAVAMDASGLMRALEDLAAAGRDWDELSVGDEIRVVVRVFQKRLEESRLCMAQQCDWELARATETPDRAPVRAMLIHGFTGADWPFWPLLLAGARSADETTVTLACPRRQAERVDQLWVSSWEEHLELVAEELGADPEPGPFARLAERLEAGELVDPETVGDAPGFEIGENAPAEAIAIVGTVMEWLGSEGFGRIGIVFTGPGILSREVGRLLGLFGVPHDDGLGVPIVPGTDHAAWREWLALQAEWTAGRLARFLKRRPDGLENLGVLMDGLESAIGAILDEDLGVLRASLATSECARDREALAVLDVIKRVAEEGGFDGLASEAEMALKRLGWDERAAALRARAWPLAGRIQGTIKRKHFLAWAEAALGRVGRERSSAGRQPYARVHLILAREAEAQSWDALILTGMNEGEWPRLVPSNAFLPEAARDALNRRAVKGGSQGAGHETVAQEHGLLLGDAEWRYLGLRQCFNLIEGSQSKVCFSARLRGEEDPGRLLGAADLLVKAHFVASGNVLTDDCMALLAARSAARWADVAIRIDATGNFDERGWPGSGPAEVRAAWDARRERKSPFGPYDFCLRRPPPAPLRLTCKAWEEAWCRPAIVWLREVVGVEPVAPFGEPNFEVRSVGDWAQVWLARALNPEGQGVWVKAPEAHAALSRVRNAAGETQARVQRIFRAAGREVPVFWAAVWKHALWTAASMCEEALGEGGGYLGTEWHLPEECHIDVGDGALFWLRGRIDLLCSDAPQFGGAVTVIGFKTTGAELSLTPTEINKGRGLHLVLCGEALRELGASRVSLSVIRLGGGGSRRQIERGVVIGQMGALARMQETGAFGVRGEMCGEFGLAPKYPMATLPVSADINDERWALTHRGTWGYEA